MVKQIQDLAHLTQTIAYLHTWYIYHTVRSSRIDISVSSDKERKPHIICPAQTYPVTLSEDMDSLQNVVHQFFLIKGTSKENIYNKSFTPLLQIFKNTLHDHSPCKAINQHACIMHQY